MSALPLDRLSPYERDMRDQPDALRHQLAIPLPHHLERLDLDSYNRIILTGMGSSHSAAIPLWRALVARGWPAWWVDRAARATGSRATG